MCCLMLQLFPVKLNNLLHNVMLLLSKTDGKYDNYSTWTISVAGYVKQTKGSVLITHSYT